MRRAGTAFAVLVGCWVAACVGDDPQSNGADPSVPVGQYRGACTAEGKCIEGLACTQGVCLYADGGGPAGDGSVDFPACTVTATDPLNPAVACGPRPACTTRCCVGQTGEPLCDDGCDLPNLKVLKCDSKNQCAGSPCCMALAKQVNTTTCPHPVPYFDLTDVACVPSGCDRGSFQYEMCRNNDDCTSPDRCFQIEIQTADTKLQYGICL